MNFRLRLFSILLALIVIGVPVSVSGESQSKIENPKSQIGNYCVECHTTSWANALDWARPVEWARDIPCNTLRKTYEDIFQYDSLVGAFANANAELRAQMVDTSAYEKRFNAKRLAALKPMQDDLVSLAAFSNAERAARFQMNKSYAALNETRVARGQSVMLIAALVGTLVLVVGIALAWRHTLKGKGVAVRSSTFVPLTILAMAIVFAIFALPIFAYSPPLPDATEEETLRQTASDQAARVSEMATRLSAQSWTLARIGAQWSVLNKAQGASALNDARQAAREKEIQSLAYWGQTQQLRESAVAWNHSTQDLATYRAEAMDYSASSAWQYRAMASEWINLDKAKAIELLEMGLAHANDLEVRAIAVTYGQLDKAKANELVARIGDPMIRAWGWRELGAFDKATEAARQISANYDRAWALREIARASRNTALLDEALAAIAKLDRTDSKAYATADVVMVMAMLDVNKARDLAQKLDAAYPEARAYAWRGIGGALIGKDNAGAQQAFDLGLAEAKKISNRFLSEKIFAALLIDKALVNPGVASQVPQISDVLLRDQVYVAIASRVSVDVTKQIASPAMRVLAFTQIGKASAQAGDKVKAQTNFKAAFDLADQLEDTWVLRDLAMAWAEVDSQSALAVVDKLEDNVSKTQVLQVIVRQLGKTDKAASAQAFDRALNVAKSIRVLGDSFASARALASLGASYAATDAARANQAFALALDVAKKVNVKY
jgi:hypothetical protein